jgi:hypothetical protein
MIHHCAELMNSLDVSTAKLYNSFARIVESVKRSHPRIQRTDTLILDFDASFVIGNWDVEIVVSNTVY